MDFDAKSSTLRPKQNPEVLPASQYLQDRLQERRARNTRPKRTRQSDFGPRMTAGQDDDLFFAEGEDSRHAFDSSPMAPITKYGSDNANSSSTLSAGGRKRRMPGARELDEQMDRLTKQNFDLKLELDHRRESQAKLHAEIEAMRATVERAQRLEEEHEELMRINSLLVEELEKRDRAIQEAADIICELEEKVEDYEEARPGTAHADSGYAGTEIQDQMLLSSPQEAANDPAALRQSPTAAALASSGLNSAVQNQPSPKPRREPAFLTSKKPSTTALRAVYLDAGKDLHPVKSFNSILSRHASTVDINALAEEVLNSPRLSALSESSFPSIYGKKSATPEKYDWEELPESSGPYGSAHSRQDSITRVSQWIEDRQIMAEVPSKANSISPPDSTVTTMPASHVLRRSAENSIQSLSSAAASARSDLLETPASIKPFPTLGSRTKQAPRTPASTSMSTFDNAYLPPTPESVSTRTRRPSRSSFVGDRNLALAQERNSTLHQPRPISRGHSLAQAALTQDALEDFDDTSDDEYYETRSNTLQDGLDYDGFPDGNSITNGTPSRFLKHGKQLSIATDMFYNSSDLGPQTAIHEAQRRKSSYEISTTPQRKPGLHRADTSPNAYGFAARRMHSSHGRPSTAGSNVSPYSYNSYNSALSSVRTPTQNRHARSLSPESSHYLSQPVSTPSATASSPPASRPYPAGTPGSATRSTFSNLFRRLSNTASSYNGDESRSTPRRDREVSPLPTLTSTPSSAYQVPFPDRREIRRPNTSASMRPKTTRAVSRDASSTRPVSRPSISPRTMTEPNFAPNESAGSLGQMDSSAPAPKRGLFRKAGSILSADVSSVRSLKR